MFQSKADNRIEQTNNVSECEKDPIIVSDEWDEYNEAVFKTVYFSGCDVKPKNSPRD